MISIKILSRSLGSVGRKNGQEKLSHNFIFMQPIKDRWLIGRGERIELMQPLKRGRSFTLINGVIAADYEEAEPINPPVNYALERSVRTNYWIHRLMRLVVSLIAAWLDGFSFTENQYFFQREGWKIEYIGFWEATQGLLAFDLFQSQRVKERCQWSLWRTNEKRWIFDENDHLHHFTSTGKPVTQTFDLNEDHCCKKFCGRPGKFLIHTYPAVPELLPGPIGIIPTEETDEELIDVNADTVTQHITTIKDDDPEANELYSTAQNQLWWNGENFEAAGKPGDFIDWPQEISDDSGDSTISYYTDSTDELDDNLDWNTDNDDSF